MLHHLFRLSAVLEYTVPVTGFQSKLHLSLADVSIDTFPIPSVVYLYLSHSKTDQFRKGCTILFAQSDGPICPVSASMSYLHQRGLSPGPLFHFSDGRPLMCQRLQTRLQAILKAAGWPGKYTLHSFLVGAATTAASLGFLDYLIQTMGRWSSEAYKIYIKLPKPHLLKASCSLASASQLANLNMSFVIFVGLVSHQYSYKCINPLAICDFLRCKYRRISCLVHAPSPLLIHRPSPQQSVYDLFYKNYLKIKKNKKN